MSDSPEYVTVELPFIEQLMAQWWQFIPGDTHNPAVTERGSFREVLLEERLRAAIRRINLDDAGREWLDEPRVKQAVNALRRLGPGSHRLMEANQVATDLLLTGTTVEGDRERHGGKGVTVRYIDFDHPERNDFLVINQFRADPPSGVGIKDAIIPDLVLFVNGIPLAVVECKSPGITDPIDAAITQLLSYSNMREWVPEAEGVERLFWYNQLMVATSGDDAQIGTVGASYPHYIQWKDTSPVPMTQVAEELGVAPNQELSSQQILVAGALRPMHLLDLVRNFILFQQSGGRTIKIAGRYQQFRAVQETVRRLQTGRTRREDGEHDRRGGIVWHTQGSGKSLTMVFLVRKMRTLPDLRRFKIVVVTDRSDLERQLSETARLTGETVRIARNTAKLQEILAEEGPDLVFAMIQKYQLRDEDEPEQLATRQHSRMAAEEPQAYDARPRSARPKKVEDVEFPILNESEHILVLVDEAHRSQSSTLHAALRKALPNAAMIGFTGTPILIGEQKRTHEIFGEFIDRYTIKQSEDDGVTVPILYEGHEVEPAIIDGRTLDDVFEEEFAHLSSEDRERLKRDYANQTAILEAPQLIRAKARDMLRHYVNTIMPDGFKAQVVAASRKAAVRYQQELERARDELIAELEDLAEPIGEPDQSPTEAGFLDRARRHLETIRRLEFAAIISGEQHDPPSWSQWTTPGKQDAYIQRFKRDLVNDGPALQDGLAMLCVKSMLLTGFDAPVEQALYIDRLMKGHELLQAVARANRTAPGKGYGLVVDYVGLALRLQEALSVYRDEDIVGALSSIRDELPILADRHQRVLSIFGGLDVRTQSDACVALLRDKRLRADFGVKLRQFLDTFGNVLPRPEALPYVADAKALGFINIRARNLYRDEQMNLRAEGEKVRSLIDQFVISRGINPTVPPMSILDAEFDAYVDSQPSSKAAATEMEHAARHHISTHLDEDPIRYERLSKRLEDLIARFADNWDQLAIELRHLVEELQRDRPEDERIVGSAEAPFFDILVDEIASIRDVESLPDDEMARLAGAITEIVSHIRLEIGLVDFWRNAVAQQRLRNWIVLYLDDHDIVPFNRQAGVADRLTQLAKQRHTWLME